MERGVAEISETLPGTGPDQGVAVSVRSVSKSFRIPHQPYATVRERVLHPFSVPGSETLEAVSDVSFEIATGEFLGIVGRNGSGKSTLLRCMSGIYLPDRGEVLTEGSVVPFIELGIAFEEDMAARDNALISAVMLGMTRAEAKRRFDEMIEFAELEEFRDLKLRNYSGGMRLRLAFAVTAFTNADLVLFDEVLAVGDAAFERKCAAHLGRLREKGRTGVIVSHDMDLVERFCDRALLMERGRMVVAGDPAMVARRYEALNAGGPAAARVTAGDPGPGGLFVGDGEALVPGMRRVGSEKRSIRRLISVVWTLAVAQFRARYLESKLSYLWTVARPMAMFGVLYLVFTQLGRFDEGVEAYPIYLLTMIVLWTFFAQTTSVSVQSLVHHGGLLRKVPIPHLAIPLSIVLSALFDLAMNMIAVVVFILAYGIAPQLGWLQMPLIVALLSVLVSGLGMMLAALYVRLRDVDQVWQVVSQALFYLSPIFYVTAALPADLQAPSLYNPLATAFTQTRHVLIDPAAPSAVEVIGNPIKLAIPLGIVFGALALGAWVFNRQSASAAERL